MASDSDSDSDSGLYSEGWLRKQLNWPKNKTAALESEHKVVNLSSAKVIDVSNNSLVISSSDDEECEEEIKVIFVPDSKNIFRFPIVPSASFNTIFDKISKLKSVLLEQVEIVMTPENRDVSQYDSLKSLNYTACNIFNVHIKDNSKLLSLSRGNGNIQVTCVTPNKINMVYKMEYHQPLDILIRYCARDVHREISTIKLFFDGEVIRPTDTCSSLGLENQDLVEIHFI